MDLTQNTGQVQDIDASGSTLAINGLFQNLVGSAGNDQLFAASGSTIYGGGGNDTLAGGSGPVTLKAGTGNDTLIAGTPAEQPQQRLPPARTDGPHASSKDRIAICPTPM